MKPGETNYLKTASDIVESIPAEWMNAEIFIANGIGGLVPIRRISLQKNDAGRIVILLHQEDFSQ